MCVIGLSSTERLTPEMVAKMFKANQHGAGVAWRDAGKVIWKKGLNLEEVVELCQKMPMPYVAHFRIPSCGGPHPSLTHPFPIQKDVPLDLEGETTGSVLFHNGHWNAWKTTMLDASVRGSGKIPIGKWSDSRAMAWMSAHYGIGMLEFIDEKAVVFGPEELELFSPHSWSKVGTGIWVSNKGWEHERVDSQWTRPPYYGVAPKKDDSVESPSDPEEPSKGKKVELLGAGGTKASSGNGGPTGLINSKQGSGGASQTGRPFEVYQASVRLWMKGDISGKSFKKERKKYEQWCREKKIQPLEKPHKDDKPRSTTVH